MKQYSAPGWFITLAVVLLLPLFQMPLLIQDMNNAGEGGNFLLWMYPVYAVTSAGLACRCYDSRRALAWILLVLLVLSHVAMWMMSRYPVM